MKKTQKVERLNRQFSIDISRIKQADKPIDHILKRKTKKKEPLKSKEKFIQIIRFSVPLTVLSRYEQCQHEPQAQSILDRIRELWFQEPTLRGIQRS